MDDNTMQLVIPTAELVQTMEEASARRWFHREPRKHRMVDENRRLKEENTRLKRENDEMSDASIRQSLELQEARQQLEELREELRLAREANRANTMGIDFRFAERPIAGPEDMATMPVPQVELLADEPSVVAVAANAATALLDRVVPKTPLAIEPPAETRALPVITAVKPLVVDEEREEPEVYNETGGSWQARQPAVMPTVTWGQPSRELRADQSSTGTFKVVSLQARGTTPTTIPGLTRV